MLCNRDHGVRYRSEENGFVSRTEEHSDIALLDDFWTSSSSRLHEANQFKRQSALKLATQNLWPFPDCGLAPWDEGLAEFR